jgi:hypothetical protein
MAFLRWVNENLNLLKNPYLNCMDDSIKLPKHLEFQRPVTTEDLRFVFSQVEKRVKETADDGDRLNAKSLTIITVSLTFITALIGFMVSQLRDFRLNDMPLLITALYVIIELIIVVVNLKMNIYPINYQSIGSKPSDLLVDSMFPKDDDKVSVEWRMLYSEILSFEERVMLNERNNDARNGRIKKAYNALYRIPLFSFIICLLVVFYLLCFSFISNLYFSLFN